ncbi:tumor necrosis factor (ligand) superfamily, member 10 like 4 isoform X1 [Rhinichthys klamathensis goyatoka]|uniref:tumor necrosis factor (ligand) superfamily, member 10 like 4 isoform X1 n=1 Tax=Rhinichthys klamathensis goyatoka TaxID=3034132 RepID=UPI0024B4FC74|nr:tumor necrosis factor (ligand) superfamily, member 10 like 4 isoform X1 [Rhinichthys klamathensis goyatoka]
MTSNIPTSPNYCQLDENTSENKNAKGQYIFFLILTLILSTETFITAFLLYDFCEDIHRTRETGRDGGYPIHCLSSDVTQPADQAGIASCDLFNQELTQTARQRLLLDIQNDVLGTLGEHNITEIFKPAVHVGAKQELKQYQRLQKNADETPELDRIQWDNMNGQFSQEGLMSLSPEGEIVVPHDGIYFVFSQVNFETQLGQSRHFTQYLYKKTASYPRPVMLAKAIVTPCVSVRSGVQLYSNHQGALFRLEKGDRLSLYVLNISDVRFPQEATYFGAFMIN